MSGIGSMRHYGVLKAPTRVSQPGGGGTTTYGQIWAGFGRLTADSSSKQQQNSQTFLEQRKRWVMHWEPGFIPLQGWQLIFENQTYAVVGVRDVEERRRYWVLNLLLNDAR